MVGYGGAGALVVRGSFDSGPNGVFVNYKPPVKRIRMEELKFDEMKGFMIKDYNLQLKIKIKRASYSKSVRNHFNLLLIRHYGFPDSSTA